MVQEAFETTKSSLFISSSFTPYTIVLSAFVQGADTRTFFAPALRCMEAFSFDVNSPVHSRATSIFNLFQGNF